MVLVEDERYINPVDVGLIENAGPKGSRVFVQGKEVYFKMRAEELAKLISQELKIGSLKR